MTKVAEAGSRATERVPTVRQSLYFPGTDGVRVCAHDFGGKGDVVLIAHAAGFCGGAYAPIADRLRGRFNVWAVDLRGHGDSTEPDDGDFSWDGMARDLLAVTEGLGRDRTLLFGHSLGGAAGLRAQALRPGTFGSIYVYEPAVLPAIDGIDDASEGMANLVRQRRAVFASRSQASERLASRPPFDTMSAESLRSFTTHGLRETADARLALKCRPDNEALVYEAANKITLADVAQVDVPVVIGLGDRQDGLPALAAPHVCASLSNARLATYPGLGHMGPFEDPSSVAASAESHFMDA